MRCSFHYAWKVVKLEEWENWKRKSQKSWRNDFFDGDCKAHHKTTVALICSFVGATSRCEKQSAKDVIKMKCKNENFYGNETWQKLEMVTRENHMCVKAICIMEKDIPGCFRRPPQHSHTQQLFPLCLLLFAGDIFALSLCHFPSSSS